MTKKDIIVIAESSSEETIAFIQIRETYSITDEFIKDLIAYDIIKPDTEQYDEWQIDQLQLKRLLTTLRLQRDLEVNLAGAALVLELMDELDALRARAEFLEKHILK